MTFAIEPFSTNGAGFICEGGVPAIFGLASARPLKTDLSRALLAKIRTFSGLPFAIHDLISQEWPVSKVELGLSELIKVGVVVGYTP